MQRVDSQSLKRQELFFPKLGTKSIQVQKDLHAIGRILQKEKSISFNSIKTILQNKRRLTPPFILYNQIFSFSKLELLLDSLFNGVAIGSVLLVAALGLAIVFGLMGVINLAHGELMMLGAYTTYVTQLIFKLPILKPFYNSYIIVSIFLAFIVSGVVGILPVSYTHLTLPTICSV